MPARIITWPMKEKCSPVDSEVNPVTVTAEVAVNAASTKGVDVPSAEANGMAKSTVKTAMTRANTEAVARAGRPVARSAILRRNVSPPLWWSRAPGLYAECLTNPILVVSCSGDQCCPAVSGSEHVINIALASPKDTTSYASQ